MTGTNHTLTGVAIGLAVHQPAVAIPIALGSHFLLDAMPHYGDPDVTSRRFLTILAIEGLNIAAIFAVLLATQPEHWLLGVMCGLAAASPDFMWLPNFLRMLVFKTKRKSYMHPITRFHKHIQWAEKPYNWPYELIWFAGIIFIVAKLAGFL